jgi:hypothetical protein
MRRVTRIIKATKAKNGGRADVTGIFDRKREAENAERPTVRAGLVIAQRRRRIAEIDAGREKDQDATTARIKTQHDKIDIPLR